MSHIRLRRRCRPEPVGGCALLLLQVGLDGLKLTQVSLGHQHGVEVLILVPKTLLYLVSLNGVESEVSSLGIERTV